MNTVISILEDFVKAKTNVYESDERYSRGGELKNKFHSRFPKESMYSQQGPFSTKEVFDIPYFSNPEWEKRRIKFIPEALYNKKFQLGEFEISIQHHIETEHRNGGYGFSSWGCESYYFHITEEWNVIMKYHGVYLSMGDWHQKISIEADNCKPTQTNWHWIKPTEKKPFILEEATLQQHFNKYEKIEEFFELLNSCVIHPEPQTLEIQKRYTLNKKEPKKLQTYTREEIDIEWFVKSETKNGVYTPERATISRLLFAWREWKVEQPKNLDRQLLKKLGIHIVQLRADSHFRLEDLFDIKGISIKGPKPVIVRYKYEKYCVNKDLVKKIATEKIAAKKAADLFKYNNQFTLTHHGKIILTDVDKSEIIQYLEEYSAKKENFEDQIFSTVRPIFEDFTHINKLYIAYWGTFYKYELAGQRCELNYECDHMNNHIDEDDLIKINELYENARLVYIDSDVLDAKYGREERGGTILGIKKAKNGKLSIFTENYDFE